MFGLFVYWKNQQNIEFWVFSFLGKLFPTLNNKIKYDIYQTHIKVVGNQTTLRNLHTLCNKHLNFVKFKTYSMAERACGLQIFFFSYKTL